jgi:hypothetical protein
MRTPNLSVPKEKLFNKPNILRQRTQRSIEGSCDWRSPEYFDDWSNAQWIKTSNPITAQINTP